MRRKKQPAEGVQAFEEKLLFPPHPIDKFRLQGYPAPFATIVVIVDKSAFIATASTSTGRVSGNWQLLVHPSASLSILLLGFITLAFSTTTTLAILAVFFSLAAAEE